MSTDSVTQPDASYQGLIYNVFQQPLLPGSTAGFTVGLVAAHAGAGTTHVASMLSDSLNRDAGNCAISLDCRTLAELSGDPRRLSVSRRGDSPAWPAGSPGLQSSWRGSRNFRTAYLAELRESFSYVLIDCPSLKESTEVLGLAPLVDGILLVVEANRTARSQITYLERTIEGAGGKVLGHILNKRTYPIPNWVFAKLERWGF